MDDNLEAAVARHTKDLSVSQDHAEDGGPSDVQVVFRVSREQRDEYRRMAEAVGKPLSEIIREHLDFMVQDVLYCSHPLPHKVYPWSEFCLKCGARLR